MSISAALRTPDEALAACSADDKRLRRLHTLIDELSLQRGEFTLSSGRKSNYLFQLRQTTMHPEGASLIGDLIVDFMRQHQIKCVGGLELGAVPVVSAAAVMSFQKDHPVAAFFVRKEAKKHGAKERIDGHILDGEDVLVVDDVTTTGQSMLLTIEPIRHKHCRINKALSIVDREEGAAEFLAERGITLYSFFRRSDFRIE